MIEGLGVDIVEISRLKKVIERWGEIFLHKIFTDQELTYARSRKNPIHHIAARFAVKEAVAKALTTGWRSGFRWRDVEVDNDARGKPSVILYGRVKELLKDSKVLISISHSESIVIAFAVIEK